MRRLIVVGFVAATAVAAAVAHRPLGAEQSQPGPTNAPLHDVESCRHHECDPVAASRAYSGIVSNWPLANYELEQMRQSFSVAAQLYPVFKSIPLAQLIKDESEPPLVDLGKAIEIKNSADFTKAFARLTDACNHCHRQVGLGFVVIRVPTSSPFSNQLFPPAQ